MHMGDKEIYSPHKKIRIPKNSRDIIRVIDLEEIIGISKLNATIHSLKQELLKRITLCIDHIIFERGSLLISIIFLDKISGLIIDLWRYEINDLRHMQEIVNKALEYFNEIRENINRNISFFIFIELIPEKVIFQGIYYTRDLLGNEQDLALLEIFKKNVNESSSKFLLDKRSSKVIEYYIHPELADIINRENIDPRRCVEKIHESINNILVEEGIREDIITLLSVSKRCHVYTSLILQMD